MATDHDERKELSALLSRPFLGACSLVVVLAGVVVGVWASGIKEDIASIKSTLNERADLPPRTAELERRDVDKEGRLREVERDHWRFKTH